MSIDTDNIIDNDESWQISLKQLVAQQNVETTAEILPVKDKSDNNEADIITLDVSVGTLSGRIDDNETSVNDITTIQTVVMGNNPSDAELRLHYGTLTKDGLTIAIRAANGAMYLIGYDYSADTFFNTKMTEAT